MKVYHGCWDDSPKKFIAECDTVEDAYKIIDKYASNSPYARFTDDTVENKQVVVDYGSWSDFIFITGVDNIGVFLEE